MSTAKIISLETVKAGVNANLFHPFNDPITLRMTTRFSYDVLKLPSPAVQLTYQIIDFRTNEVFEFWRFQFNYIYVVSEAWVDLPTAHDLGLNWIGSDLFGFRGAVEILSGQPGGAGLQATDIFDVSDVHWFRVEPIFLE